MKLIDADKLLLEFKERAEAAERWQETAKDEEIKIRAAATLDFLTEVKLTIEKAPTVDKGYYEGHVDGMLQAEKLYARPIGEWLEDSGNIACSHCHAIWLYRRTNYCPNCGADMREAKE